MKKLLLSLLACMMFVSCLTLQVAAEDVEFNAYITQEYATINEALAITLENASGNTTYQWYVDGIKKGTNATLLVDESMQNAIIEVDITNNGTTIHDRLMVSNLPVIFIDTENNQAITSKEDYINADMKIQANERYADLLSDSKKSYDGVTEIRGRGNSTWNLPKKPYKLKLDKKTDLFGMGKNKHWVLLASYYDESFMRNTISYGLSGKLGMPFCDSVWVEVVLNGEKVGNYMLCEQIRVGDIRVDIYDWESACEDGAAAIAEANNFSDDDASNLEDIMVEDYSWIDSDSVTYNNTTYKVSDYFEYPNATGGYLFEMDEYYDEISKFKTDLNQPIMFKYPEFANTSDTLFANAQKAVQDMEDAFTAEDFYIWKNSTEVHYSEFVDMQSLVDFWLVNELFFNEDFMKKSTYFYKDIDGKIFMGPIWDMDWAASGAGQTSIYNQWQTLYFSANAQSNQWYKYLVKEPYFVLKARERFLEIEPLIDAYIVDGGWIDQEIEYLKESGALNDSIWHGSNAFINDATKLKTWLTNRKNWLKQQFTSKSSIFSSFNLSDDTTLKNKITFSINGETVSENADEVIVVRKDQSVKMSASRIANGKYEFYINGDPSGSNTTEAQMLDETFSYDYLIRNKEGINTLTIKYVNDNTKRTIIFEPTGIADTSELVALIDQAKTLDEAKFSASDYAALTSKLTSIQALLDAKDYTKEEISSATNELKAIMATYQNEFEASITQAYAKVGTALDLTLADAIGTTTYKWYVDGVLTSQNPTLFISEDMMNKIITVEAINNGQSAYDRMMVSNLPVIFIDTENSQAITSKEDYINADMKIQANERYAEVLSDPKKSYDGLTEIRGRGNSTWGLPKKPYKLKLDKKTDLFGMGKNKHWVLLASYYDESFMRNTISYGLSGKLGMPFCDSRWVEVVLNGEKVGNYMLCEQIRVDETRIDVYDWESACEDAAAAIAEANNFSDDDASNLEDIMVEDYSWIDSDSVTYNNTTYKVSDYFEYPDATGGYLFEMDSYYDEISKFKTSLNQPIMFKNPEYANTSDELFNYAKGYVQAMENAFTAVNYHTTYDGKKMHYSELVDLQSLLDFWIVNELFFNEDFMKKSTYFYKEVDEKAYMGPIWDMDWAASGAGQTSYYDKWQTLYFSAEAQASQWYKSLVNDPFFLLKVRERYLEIEDLIDEYIIDGGWIDQEKVYLADSGALNDSIWHGNNAFINDANKLKTWLTNRKKWLDTQFASKDSIFTSFNVNEYDGISITGKTSQDIDIIFDQSDLGYIQEGDGVTLAVNAANGDYTVYINGIEYDTLKVTNNTATLALTNEEIMVDADKINVVTFKNYATNQAKTIAIAYEPEPDPTSLIATIEKAKLYDGSGYDTLSYLELQKAINDAQNYLDTNVEYSMIVLNDYENNIKTAINNLIPLGLNEKTLINTKANENVSVVDYSSECVLDGYPSEDGQASNTLDYNEASYWHNNYRSSRQLPQYITYELNDIYYLSDIKFLPRQNDSANGDIFKVEIYTKTTQDEEFTLATTCEFEKNGNYYVDRDWKRVVVGNKEAKYVMFKVVASGGKTLDIYATMAEIRFYGVSKTNYIDKSALEAKLIEALSINTNEYTQASVEVLNKAINEAKAIYESSETTKEEVQQQVDKLDVAIKQLEKASVNKVALQVLYDANKDKQANTYTETSFEVFKQALEAAEVVLANENATQNEVNEAKVALEEAIKALQERPIVNKDALKATIEIAKTLDTTNKTADSVAALNSAITAAQGVVDKADATQDEVDKAKATLEEAITGLKDEEKPAEVNKTALKAAIDTAKKIDTTNKTDDSKAVLASALTAAESVYANANATQDEVNAAKANLEAAVANLKDKPQDPKPVMDFYDVQDKKAWFYGSVESAFTKGLMGATGKAPVNGKPFFEPDTPISRGMVATVLYRMAGQPKVEFKATFTDVTNPKLWYSTAITWASQAGVVSGYKDGRFGPDDNITRQDLAIMLRNYAKSCGLDTNVKVDFSSFKDGNKVVSYAQSAIAFCIDAKLMSGAKKADGVYLNPSDKATRAECAKMFSLLDDAIKAK